MYNIYIYMLYIYSGISQVLPWLTSLTIKLVKIPATQESWGAGLEPRPEGKKRVAICWDYFILSYHVY